MHEQGLLMVESVGLSIQSSHGLSSQVDLSTSKKIKRHYIPVGIPDPVFDVNKSVGLSQ